MFRAAEMFNIVNMLAMKVSDPARRGSVISSKRPNDRPWMAGLGASGFGGQCFKFAHALARRSNAVLIAAAPCFIMTPICVAAWSGRISAIHTTRLPPISLG